MKILLIGTWGNPGGWREVVYRVPRPPENPKKFSRLINWDFQNRLECRCSASTAALSRALEEAKYKVKVLLIGVDTVTGGEGNTYPEIVEGVKTYYMKYAMEFFDYEPELLILPGVGRFGKRFRGAPGNGLPLLVLRLLELFEQEDFDSIVLDLSHGINFMPVLVSEEVEKVFSFLSALSPGGLSLIRFNSDPVIRDVKEAFINIIGIRRRSMEPWILLQETGRISKNHVYRLMTRKTSKWTQNKLNELQETFNTALEKIQREAALMSYGLVLPLLKIHDARCLSELQKSMKELLRDLILHREVSDGLVSYDFVLDHRAIDDVLLSLWLLTRTLPKEAKSEVSVDELREIAESRLRLGPLQLTLMNREISKIKEAIKGKTEGEWSYWELLGYEPEDFGDMEVKVRNFIAHAGFDAHLLRITKKRDGIFVKYDESSKDYIMKIIKNIYSKWIKAS